MSSIIRDKRVGGHGAIKAFQPISKKFARSIPVHTVENKYSLAGYSTISNVPFITFKDMFFSGRRSFIIDFLLKNDQSDEGKIIGYNPYYNRKKGSFSYPSGNPTPPDFAYTGKEPIKFKLFFNTISRNETDEFVIQLLLEYDIRTSTFPNPFYAPKYHVGDDVPDSVPDQYTRLFDNPTDDQLKYIHQSDLNVRRQKSIINYDIPEGLSVEEAVYYSFCKSR